jgi:hypothetical protein
LQQFFRWLAEEEGAPSPMAGMRLGAVRPPEVKPLTDDQLCDLLASCRVGLGFPHTAAMVRIRLAAN